MRRVGLSARRPTAWSALTRVGAPRGGRGRPRHEQALSGAPESDAHTLPRPRPAAHAGPCKWTRPRTPPVRVHRRHRLRRPARALRVAAPGKAAPEASRHVDGPAHSAAGAARGRPPPSSPPSSTACPTSLPIPVAAAAGLPRIVGIPTEWGHHLWGRRDPRDAPGGKVCDNFPHFAPPRIFLGNTRVSKVKYGDTPVTSP